MYLPVELRLVIHEGRAAVSTMSYDTSDAILDQPQHLRWGCVTDDHPLVEEGHPAAREPEQEIPHDLPLGPHEILERPRGHLAELRPAHGTDGRELLPRDGPLWSAAAGVPDEFQIIILTAEIAPVTDETGEVVVRGDPHADSWRDPHDQFPGEHHRESLLINIRESLAVQVVTYHGASPVASSDGVSNLLSQIAQTPEGLFLFRRGWFRSPVPGCQSLPLHRR